MIDNQIRAALVRGYLIRDQHLDESDVLLEKYTEACEAANKSQICLTIDEVENSAHIIFVPVRPITPKLAAEMEVIFENVCDPPSDDEECPWMDIDCEAAVEFGNLPIVTARHIAACIAKQERQLH